MIGLSNGYKCAWFLVVSRVKKLHARELSRNQSILCFDIIRQHDWPIESCLLHNYYGFLWGENEESSLTQNFKKTNIPLRHQIPCHYSLNDFLTTKGRTSSSNRVNKFSKVVIDHFLFNARHLWHWTVPRLTQLSPLPPPFQYEYTCRELPPTGIAQFKGSLRCTLNPLTKACVAAGPHID